MPSPNERRHEITARTTSGSLPVALGLGLLVLAVASVVLGVLQLAQSGAVGVPLALAVLLLLAGLVTLAGLYMQQPNEARLLTLYAAWKIETSGVKSAMTEISAIKVIAPNMLQGIVDQAIQIHGGAGVSNDVPLTSLFAIARALRIADGPDEVHRAMVARMELNRHGLGQRSAAKEHRA